MAHSCSNSSNSSASPSSSSGVPLKVVHIFSPRIFRSDADNFRALVQCLTGNNKRPFCDPLIPLGCTEVTPRKRLVSSADFAPCWSVNNQQRHSWESLPAAAAHGDGGGARINRFNEVDIVSGLISSEMPLPDCTMLPPLPGAYDQTPAFAMRRYPSIAS